MRHASFLSDDCPPMGIYETLYSFRDTFGSASGYSPRFPATRAQT